MNTEQTFDAANKYLRGRVNVLNNMSSRELSEQLLPEIRAQAFFSARVAEARVLEKLREVSARYSSGEIDAATCRLEIKNWLKVKENVDDESIRGALMSTSRLDLILNQNQMMAAAVGARELALDPEIYEALPYYKFVPSTSASPRDEHSKFYGIVLDKKHPFWETHTPPIDFNCKCSLDELTAEEAGMEPETAKRRNGETASDDTPESGYVFNVAAPFDVNDLGRLNDPFRESVVEMMTDQAAKGNLGRLSFLGAAPTSGEIVAADMRNAEKALGRLVAPAADSLKNAGLNPASLPAFGKIHEAYKSKGLNPLEIPENIISAFGAPVDLGDLPSGLAASLGIKNVPVVLSAGDRGYGVGHNWRNHKEVFATPGESAAIIKGSIFNTGSRTALTVIPKKKREPRILAAFHNPGTKAFSVAEIRNGRAELVSWYRAEDEEYLNFEWRKDADKS